MPIIGEIRSFATDDQKAIAVYRRHGWLECNGTALNKSQYAKLHSVIGDRWGQYGAGCFRLPDLAGLFLRGLQRSSDDLNRRDPDLETRKPLHPGGSSGGNVGSYQLDTFEKHSHRVKEQIFRANGITNDPAGHDAYYGENPTPVGPETDALGGSETRPKNAYALFMIFAGTPAVQRMDDRLIYPDSDEFVTTDAELAAALSVCLKSTKI